MQHIVVKEYNVQYPSLFLKEKDLILPILKENLISIFHIGSTSVPFLKAKPIIDILIVVKDLKKVDEKKKEWEAVGYEYLGEFGIKGRRYCRKGGDERTHQVHIFQEEDEGNIVRHLAVREYLRNHPNVAKEYGALKEDLARRFPYDIDSYCNGKEKYMTQLEENALKEWREKDLCVKDLNSY